MKYKIFLTLVASLAATCINVYAADFVLEAHRGIAHRYPENTVTSFKKALAIDVYGGVETDVQRTKDGVLVIMHDDTIDRTTNGTGKVSDYTLEELQEFYIDGGMGWKDSYAGKLRVPTFEQFLKLIKETDKVPYVELKLLDNDGIAATVRMLEDMGFKGRYVLTSFKKEYLVYAKTITDAPLEYMKSKISDEYIQDCIDNNFIIRAKSTSINDAFVKKCRNAGLRMECYGIPVGDARLLAKLKAWGVEGGTCNDWKKLGYEWNYTDASTLTSATKLLKTENPYHRLDITKYDGLGKSERKQAQMSLGITISFTTDSKLIGVRPVFTQVHKGNSNSSSIATRGFDLYIQKDGEWRWAGSVSGYEDNGVATPLIITNQLNEGEKKCLIYLPNNSSLESLDIITARNSYIKQGPVPFKHRIAVFGSSYTHGSGTSRPGMCYAAQLSRMTGFNFINMGFSGNSKLQPYFADVLIEADNVDAYVFDAFSNPTIAQIEERLEPFIQKFQQAKPGIPLIFMQTIYREKRAFSDSYEKKEADRIKRANELMTEMCRKYKNVYWLTCTNATDEYHSSTTDGSHPNDRGYTLWAESVREPIMKILAKYNIK